MTLSKLADTHIDIEIDPLELEEVVDRVHPTYPEIKEYVLEHYGFKVSSLYIAQVKQKCGLDMRENYNHAKPGGRPQPQVFPEKEDAIRAAFKHFNMI